MSKLFVGIDVSKDSFSATGLDSKSNVSFSLSASMDKSGFSELMKAITSNCKDLSAVMAGMESTGCYHINLFSFLSSKEVNAVVINPLVISNFAKLSLRKTKTDKKDSLTIAKFILIHKDSIEQFSISQDTKDFRDIARERESISHLIASTKNEIKRILQTTFPELESICNVFTTTMLLFLKEFPSARFNGIGDATGAAFLAEIGDIANFSSHKSLIAYTGIDPTVFQSGKFEGTSRISKRGNRHLRRIVYLMTIGVIRCNAFFKAYFLKRKNDGLPFRKAVMATAHKLIRTIFAMLSHKSFFHVKGVNSL